MARQRWSSDGDVRAELKKMKVVSLEDGNIRGGHWVLNKDGDGCTIAFLWKNSSGRIFGLTTAHSFETIGDSVFVFLHGEPTPITYEDHHGFVYEMMEVGEVVSINQDTDSIVFEVTCIFTKHRFDLLKLDRKSGLGDRELRLPRPSLHPSPPTDDSKVIILGAKSRGKRCIVSTPRNEDDENWLFKHTPEQRAQNEKLRGYSEENEIGFELEAGPTRFPAFNGDCGALYLDYLTGFPLAMHHALVHFNLPRDDEPDEYEAYGFPLSLIMAKHPEQFDAEMFGPLEPAAVGDSEQDETNTRFQPSDGASARWHRASRTTTCFQVQKFNVTIPENPVIPDPATGVRIRKAVDPSASGSIIRRSKAERDA
jgi:hypothetical protein